MELSNEVLEGLKCSVCDGYLSCGPVFMLANGNSVCGRCPAPDDEASQRIIPYELLAQQMKFPCKYKPDGCPNASAFCELKKHEDYCKYRQCACPMFDPGTCNWTGSLTDVLEHCAQNHPETVAPNPLSLVHDSSTTNARTFVMAAFEMLFIIYAKVCLSSGKIYHSVHLLFNAYDDSKFNFDLVVSNQIDEIRRSGNVSTTQDCFEDDPLVLSLNVILELFGGCDGTSFNIAVSNIANQPKKLQQEQCTPKLAACSNVQLGCLYKDTRGALSKHERYYCEFNNRCHLCSRNIGDYAGDYWPTHFVIMHKDINKSLGVQWSEKIGYYEKKYIFCSTYAVLHCTLDLNNDGLKFVVRSPFPSDQLQFYTYILGMCNKKSGKIDSKILKRVVRDDNVYSDGDWEVSIDRDTFMTMYICPYGEMTLQLNCSRSLVRLHT